MEKIGEVMFSPSPLSPSRGTKEYYDEEREIYREVTHSPWAKSSLDYTKERIHGSTSNDPNTPSHQSYHHGVL